MITSVLILSNFGPALRGGKEAVKLLSCSLGGELGLRTSVQKVRIFGGEQEEMDKVPL
jgi:hypothetical protein